ncbi:2-dehydro-3-deoxygalactonokinase [Jannaschia aquimarina]|uniref:2-keto-3-deoxy-galactonokinase n=1 Tax=Jannaschia aquimarina TaxID=935700 RepID=A0A0D1E9X9_9RHOB|nr:2-dehydro-3-deoxygalactonokinase [Jannaschia aquimarina]KIT14494.1 2-keto-3-deoxy-galactonokinase [Jannaschia aquimarina]SNT28575.1 2-dehydro-3-deoxygalactonokinase [Jannaschia aquimarina]
MRWIAVDWGTTSLRAWLMDGEAPIDARNDERGMNRLTPDAFERTFLDLAADWVDGPTTVRICGMAGARQGWHEGPYRAVPCTPLDGAGVKVPVDDDRLDVAIVPGLSQTAPHADVMRGEETQIAGLLARFPDFDGCACLPGTHTKWVHLSAGEVVSFQTVMTGETFQLYAKSSVLRHSLGGDGWDDDAFDTALSEALSRPERMVARLFGLRAADLLQGQESGAARATLSGLLIGAELAATRPWWLGRDVVICGSDRTMPVYDRALRAQGVTTRTLPAAESTLAGLASLVTP